MPKFQQYYQQMVDENKPLFVKFLTVHDQFAKDKLKWNQEFNEVGIQVVEIIRDWERRLCRNMGKGAYSQYTHRLSDKFWELARADYALIDLVGVKIKK